MCLAWGRIWNSGLKCRQPENFFGTNRHDGTISFPFLLFRILSCVSLGQQDWSVAWIGWHSMSVGHPGKHFQDTSVTFSAKVFCHSPNYQTEATYQTLYREVQLDFTPEIEALFMLFERCHTKDRKRSLKQHIRYFNFRNKTHLDHPVFFPPGNAIRLTLHEMPPALAASHLSVSYFFQLWHRKISAFLENLIYVPAARHRRAVRSRQTVPGVCRKVR